MYINFLHNLYIAYIILTSLFQKEVKILKIVNESIDDIF